jgi:saccharopine dehydrogenase-like NADP-dependent oxidoreductase
MRKIIVLGAGMVGSVIARDLADDVELDVTIADINEKNLERAGLKANVMTIKTDLSNPNEIKNIIKDFDLVVGALPGHLGFQSLKTVIESGKDCCDISFMPEDPCVLHEFATKRGVMAVIDCGIAPGMSNMLVGHATKELFQVKNIEIYVGGLPRTRTWPYQYKAAFSPTDVIEEYTRPARFVENGRMVVKPAMTDAELLEFPHVGTLEAFNTDGLRTLLRTIKTERMIEKTLRYPGHIELMQILRASGFFRKDEIDIGGVKVKPMDVAEKLLFPLWTYEEGEEDITVMRVIAVGMKDGRNMRFSWDLFDTYDHVKHESSMSRTTAFPCAIIARLVASGKYKNPGIIPPEFLGRNPAIMKTVLDGLAERGINFHASTET